MVRAHHDSSQLSAALFGGGDVHYSPQKPSSQFPNQNNERQQNNPPLQQSSQFQYQNDARQQNNPPLQQSSQFQYQNDARQQNNPPLQQSSQFHYQNDARQQNNPPQSTLDRRRQWEDSLVSSGVFWGNENGPKKSTPPTDKPPDPYQYQQHQQNNHQQRQQYYDPFSQQQVYNKSPQPQYSQPSSQQQQFSQQPSPQLSRQPSPQFGPQSYQQNQPQNQFPSQQGLMTANPPTLAIPIPVNNGGMFQSAPTTPQYFPMQIPMGGPGFGGNCPMYFVMSQFPPDVTNRLSSSAPSTSDMALQSISSASSMESRWPTPPDTRGSLSNSQTTIGSKSMSRAKWGEKGVGVGRLWDPESTTDGEPYSQRTSETLSPPQWAELSQSDGQVLPGAPKSRPGEKTHARGSAVVLDSQEMAERTRKQRQALETQRIIQQQLDEKKRLQQEEEEREKKEAAMWEERVKMQQEKERKEMEEEDRKKKEKEETEERRQQKLREAIQEAAEKAKREKEEIKYKNKIIFENKQDIYPESGLETSRSARLTNLSKETIPEKDEETDESDQHHKTDHHQQYDHHKSSSEKISENDASDAVSNLGLPDIVASAQVGNLSQAQKIALLRALGIAPELLLTSGVFEKSSFMSVFGENKGSGPNPAHEDEEEYTRNVTITPTKFRNSRDCGVQCDGYTSDLSHSERRAFKRRTSKRHDAKETPRSSPEDKPQWGRHRSERPYRKQSEKDPYQGRKFRRKPVRSISVSDGRDSNTDQDSDQQGTHEPRRRRKTWGESLQESLSSDLSRSPSPKSRKGPKINLPKGPPPIKQPLTPSLQQERLNESSAFVLSTSQTRSEAKHQDFPASNEKKGDKSDPEKSVTQHTGKEKVEQPKNSERQPFRSTSPPVPALAGTSRFDIPEYPPGFELPLSISAPKQPTNSIPKSPSSKSPSLDPKGTNEDEQTIIPLMSDLVPRLRQLSLPNIARKREEEEEEDPPIPKQLNATRRASLASRPRIDSEQPIKINSITRPSSRATLPRSATQRQMTPRRLPPMNDQLASDESPVTPPNKENNQSRTVGLSTEDQERITPVEVDSKVSNPLALSPTSESLILPSPRSRRKKESSDSGISGDVSRPSSAASSQIEEVLALSSNSYGYSNLKSSSKEPKDLTVPSGDPDKWIILRSLSPVRQNFWRRNAQQPGPSTTS